MTAPAIARPALAVVKTPLEELIDDLSDAGNANYLVACLGDELMFQFDRKKWRFFKDGRWNLDQRGEVLRMTEDVVRQMIREAADLDDKAAVKRLLKHAENSLNKKKFEAILGMAEAKLPVEQQDFDQNDDVIGVANGIVDLRTGNFRAAIRNDMLTRACGAKYIDDAECPRFLAFLNQVFAGDQELISFIKRAVGYTLTGSVREQVFFLCYGGGANGKSVLLAIIAALLGDYAMTVPIETFLETRGERATNDLAAMNGARFVSASEPDESRRLASGRMKMLTGEDSVTARFMRQEFFTYRPRYKVWLASNHRPPVTDTSHGMWRRIRLIPFNVTIPDAERDDRLRETLIDEELPGILRWAIEGAVESYKDGLGAPAAVLEATNAYRTESDRVGAFIEDRCELGAEFSETFGRLYSEYTSWAKSLAEEPLRQKTFGARLDQRGIALRRTTAARLRIGVKLRSNDALMTDDGL